MAFRRTFRLTDERRRLMQLFARYRYLRTSDLYELLGAGSNVSTRAVRRLVRDFWRHGCLHRRIGNAADAAPLPQCEFAYWLSAAGVRLALSTGVAESLPDPRPNIARTLDHELAITDFHRAAVRAADHGHVDLHWEQYGLRRGVNPDALFAVTDSAKPSDASTSYWFLEIEQSRQGGYAGGQSVLLRRLKRYADYQGSTDCRRDWEWFDEFRVVIVVSTESRARNLLAVLATELPLSMFWVSVQTRELTLQTFRSPVDFRDRRYGLSA